MATKKDKVDYIYKVAKHNNLKITKTYLNGLSNEELDKYINSSPEVKDAFNSYLEFIKKEKKTTNKSKSLQNRRQEKISAVSNEKIDSLNRIVSALANNPSSFLAILDMQEFMESLKYGEIPDDVLSNNIKILTNVSPGWAMKLLDFSVNQILALQEK